MDEIRLNALKRIENDTSGGDINQVVTSLKQLKETLIQEVKQVENKISHETTNESGNIYAAIKNAEQARNSISQLKSEFELVVKEAKERQAVIENDCKQLKVYSDSANDLDKTLKYFQHLEQATDINGELKSTIEAGNHDKAVELYQSLCSLLRQVPNSSYEYQITFLKKTINYWHEVLKQIFTKEYEEILKTLKWPFISGDTTVLSNAQADLKSKFQRCTKYLLLIEMPDELKSDSIKSSSALAVDFPSISLPHKILLFPLKKRFIYHFCGNKQTNRPDKPEWMFSQVLTWIRDHEYFIHEWVQPVYEEESTQAKIEFMVGLVQIVAEKLQSDLPHLENDDALFSHMVDESLAFHRELVENFSYPTLLTSVLSVLTQAHIFVKWTNMEFKFGKKRMDNMINEEMMSNVIATEYGHNVTECGDLFITLLETMTDRYSALPQPGHRLQFLNLQLDIIDEFRTTMQLLAESKLEFPLDSSLPEIANTVSYIKFVLSEWATTPHFLMLHHFQQKLDPNNCVNESVFDEVIKGYELLTNSIIITLCDAVMLEIKARSRAYRKSWWSSINVYDVNADLTLSHTATSMFYILTNKLHYLQSTLSQILFKACWKSIAKEMNQLIFEDVIMANNFSKGGAEQLNFDICRNLVPLFAQFSQQSENCFLETIEACGILCSEKKFEDIAKEPDHTLHVNVMKEIYQLRNDRE